MNNSYQSTKNGSASPAGLVVPEQVSVVMSEIAADMRRRRC